jgi:hypothetical protein
MPVNTLIRVRRGTEEEWSSTETVKTLAQGEIGVTIDGANAGKFKIGVAAPSSNWNDLPYANPADLVTAVSGALSVSSGTLSVNGVTRYVDSSDVLVTANPYPKVTVKGGSTGPASPSVGDVWVKF